MDEAPERTEKRPRVSTARRRGLLLAAAREEFGRRGLAGTTMRDIGRCAGIDPSIVYRHFDSKEEMFDAAVAKPLEDAMAEWTDIARSSATYQQTDGRLVRTVVDEEIARLTESFASIASLLGVMLFSERGGRFYAEHFEPAITAVAEALDTAKPLWKHREFDARLLVSLVVGASVVAGIERDLGGRYEHLTSLSRGMSDLLLEGLLPRGAEPEPDPPDDPGTPGEPEA